ncbi:hypothetical protein LTS10_007830 [Elasticomyces elasticus]|nr:hypothetical protein LTS10_007830 [Elasticomyces elasticus]
MLTPLFITDADPLLQCGLRVLCFFYACKLLDLGVVRADKPPTRLLQHGKWTKAGDSQSAPMRTFGDLMSYSWLLLTEMRYRRFDIAVKQKGRPTAPSTESDRKRLMSTASPLVVLPALAWLIPSPATRCAVLLLVIQHGLEGVHTLLHPRCPEPIFYRPFVAGSLTEFWSTNWHAGASPFLQSLAYKPARKLTGSRAAGVLAAFCLTGIWHGWASAPISTQPWALGTQVWALFVGFGIGCLAEKLVWGEKQGGQLQHVIVWAVSLVGAGMCARTLECTCRYVWVRAQCG